MTGSSGEKQTVILRWVNTLLLGVTAFFMTNTYLEMKTVKDDVKKLSDIQIDHAIKQAVMEEIQRQGLNRISTSENDIKNLRDRVDQLVVNALGN